MDKFRELFTINEGKSYAKGDLKQLQTKLTKAGLNKAGGSELLKSIIDLNNNGEYNQKQLASQLKKLRTRVKKAGISPKQGLEKLDNIIKVLELNI